MHIPKRSKYAVSQSVADRAYVPKHQAIVIRVSEFSLHEMEVFEARRIQRDTRWLLNLAIRADRRGHPDYTASDKAESCSSLH